MSKEHEQEETIRHLTAASAHLDTVILEYADGGDRTVLCRQASELVGIINSLVDHWNKPTSPFCEEE